MSSIVPMRAGIVPFRRLRRAAAGGRVSPTNPNGYALDSALAGALKALTGGLPGGINRVLIRPWRFFHRVAISATAANNTQFTFFNVAETPFVTNFPQASGLPANFAFALKAIAFDIEQGVGINGAAVAAGAVAGLTGNSADVAEQVRLLYKHAQVRFSIGDRPILNTYGLDAFPSGRSLQIDCSQSTTTTTQNLATISVQNGAPLNSNLAFLDNPFPIMSGQQVALSASYATGLPLTGGGVLKAEMVGLLISPAAA